MVQHHNKLKKLSIVFYDSMIYDSMF